MLKPTPERPGAASDGEWQVKPAHYCVEVELYPRFGILTAYRKDFSACSQLTAQQFIMRLL